MADPQPQSDPTRAADWESFYASYRKPGYVRGFEITSKLGGGMFGLVFKATRQSIGKDYAIKFLKVDDGEVRRAVLAELEQVQYFAQVDHPNLVSIEDRGEVDGIPYLVMAYAGAETLRDLLPGTADTREETLRLFLQACRGVAALHERSLVHFDLKPANVFLKGGVARVGDYGLSKLITHSRGSLSMGRGTPYYMAPEMLQRRGDHRSDVYSLGVMLYEVLTGEVPFRGDSEWAVLRQHEKAEVVFPEHVPAARRAIVQRCMQKDPAQRYQSVHDLLAAFGAPASVGAAAYLDASRANLGTEPRLGAAPPPRPTVDTAPPGGTATEDPYAGFKKASREAYLHANKIAREAMQNANAVARKAAAEARATMQRAMRHSHKQHLRRAAAWPRWWRMQRAKRHREREAARAAARAARAARWGRLGRIAVGGAVLGGLLFVALLMLMPARGPVPQVAGARSVGPVVQVVKVPAGLQSVVRTASPQWVASARADLTLARAQLQSQLARFRSLAPLTTEQRMAAPELPVFGPIHGSDGDTFRQISGLLERLRKQPRFEPQLAAQLQQYGIEAAHLAAQVLGQGVFSADGGISQEAHNLQRYLEEATGFDGIAFVTDPNLDRMFRRRANENIGALWTWFLHEVAADEQEWRTYRMLQGR